MKKTTEEGLLAVFTACTLEATCWYFGVPILGHVLAGVSTLSFTGIIVLENRIQQIKSQHNAMSEAELLTADAIYLMDKKVLKTLGTDYVKELVDVVLGSGNPHKLGLLEVSLIASSAANASERDPNKTIPAPRQAIALWLSTSARLHNIEPIRVVSSRHPHN